MSRSDQRTVHHTHWTVPRCYSSGRVRHEERRTSSGDPEIRIWTTPQPTTKQMTGEHLPNPSQLPEALTPPGSLQIETRLALIFPPRQRPIR